MAFLPPLPEEVEKAIEEMAFGRNISVPRLVMQKELFASDVSRSQNRLLIPKSKIIGENFLTEEEEHYLCGYDGNRKRYKMVNMVDPSLATKTVEFCRWDMAKKNGEETSFFYFICGNWNDVVRSNKLRVGMVVQLWCYRVDGDLCFALVRLPTDQV